MGHLGLTEVLLALGLLGLIFAETIVRRLTRWLARTKPTPVLAAENPASRQELEADAPDEGEKLPSAPADAGP
jgi:hypothetical protein